VADPRDEGRACGACIFCMMGQSEKCYQRDDAPMPHPEAESLAKAFHETYERLAPSYGYETRKESAKPWSEVPEKNKRLMIAVCSEILNMVATDETVRRIKPSIAAARGSDPE